MSDLKGVGKNLRNHGYVFLNFKVNNPNTTLFPIVEENDLENEFMQYHENKRRGLLTETNKAQAFFVSSRAKADGESNWSDIHLAFNAPSRIGTASPQLIGILVKEGRMKSFGEIIFNTTAYLNGVRDDVKLALLDYRLFSDPSDTQVIIEGGL